MQVGLQHHVFSSDGGYRTTFASPGIPPESVAALEAFASAAHQVYSHGRSYSSCRLADGSTAITCVFVHGADHVGRRRLCSHSLLLPPSARAAEGFNPAVVNPNLFMTVEVPAERPGPYLRASWDIPEGDALEEARRLALQELDACSAAILSGLLAPARTLVIAGSPPEALRRLGRAAWLLPKEVRDDLLYRSGTWRAGELDGRGEVNAILLPTSTALDAYPTGEFVPVDLNQPPEQRATKGFRDPYVRMLWELKRSSNGPERLRVLLILLGNYPGPVQPSLDQQACLVEGYRQAEPALLEPELNEAARQFAPRLVAAISPLARSGRMALAEGILEMLEDALEATERSTVKQTLLVLQKELKENFYLQSQELGQRLGAYARRLRRAAMRSDAPS